MKTPEQIADEIVRLPKYTVLSADDLGYSAEQIAMEAIKADRAQREDEAAAAIKRIEDNSGSTRSTPFWADIRTLIAAIKEES